MKIKVKKLFEYFKHSRYAMIEKSTIIFIKEETLETEKLEILNNEAKENYLIYFNNKVKKELNHINGNISMSILKIENNVFLKIDTESTEQEILIELIKTVVKI